MTLSKATREKRATEKQRIVICCVCGENHNTCGNSGRKSQVCLGCYPIYRQAYKLYHACLYRSKKDGHSFNLDIPWIISGLKNPCPRTGLVFKLLVSSDGFGQRPIDSPSVDRLEPTKGYTKDNCEIVCWWYNCAKQFYSTKEVLQLCQQVVISSEMRDAQNVKKEEVIDQEIILESTVMDTIGAGLAGITSLPNAPWRPCGHN